MKGVFTKLGSMTKRGPSADGAEPRNERTSSQTGAPLNLVEREVMKLKAAEDARKTREARLAGLKPYCLDTTIVEALSTGSESLEDKLAVFKLLKSCRLQNIALAAFVKEKTPDLPFLQALRSQKLIDEHCFAYTELFDANGVDLPGQDLPFGLAKMIQFGIQNAILECDLAATYINWEKYSAEDFCALVESRCRWVAANLYAGRAQAPAAWLNLRDFAAAMQSAPARVLSLVEHAAKMDPAYRPRGIIVSETAAGHFPHEAAPCVASVRFVMEACGWVDGALLVHGAAGTGLAHATVLECLASGCSGVVATLAEEVEPGSSSAANALLDWGNLARLGNKHVAEAFDLGALRGAAREVAAVVERSRQAALEAAAKAAEAKAAGVDGGRGSGGSAPKLAHVEPLTSSPPKPHAHPHEAHKQPLIPGHA
ncbi:hypothetical protein HYH03_018394 [Edaphochlamys debaryana]|uniref:Uncharacterized protein n=1 Tax=Edaphochlamys debaryana TaxID=47281 RepID=A0A835XEP9_9CHLO|nr:hypothetical protein HYH03_018394 [Edaphochlamys debaryana]|eukprot:KAG2482688.1 hypothetical protein HYH03_018394 [Edaphochlamys debaryana]